MCGVCNDLLMDLEDDRFLLWLIFIDKATFHVRGKVYDHNMHIWGLQNPHKIKDNEQESLKNCHFLCSLSNKDLWPILFLGKW